jgi:hypothetical protein
MSGLPTLVIGVGGTGLRVLQRVKERLQETYYGEVPKQITLLEFDTALQSPADNFCGIRLNEYGTQSAMNGGATLQEMQLVHTTRNFTMDNTFEEARKGNRRWDWMEVDKMANVLPPGSRSILDGAGAFRPVGRTAFFLNYAAVENTLRASMRQVMQQQVIVGDDVLQGVKDGESAKSKRNVFLVGSLAGGTGSGGFLDIAAMMRRIKAIDTSFTDIMLIGMVVLPRFFDDIADTIGRRVPNTYAGLRELDRFMRAHKSGTPYKFVTGTGQDITIDNTLFDLCYLVDVEDYTGAQPAAKPEFGALAAMADTIVAHSDFQLGLRLNAANINFVANYALPLDRQRSNGHYSHLSRRYYSALNCHTVIFPREDVAKSLSLRFLLDLIDTHLIERDPRSNQLVIPNEPMRVDDLISFLSKDNPSAQEKIAAELSTPQGDLDLGIFIRTLLQNGLNPDRRYSTDMDNVLKWLLEDGIRRRDVQRVIDESLRASVAPPSDQHNMGSYISRVRNWQEKYLGLLVDANNPLGDRKGGEWEQAFGGLVTEERIHMEARIHDLVLRILNQRREESYGEETTSVLRANRLGYALAVLRTIKDCARNFMKQTEISFGESARNLIQLRKDLEERRAIVANFRGSVIPVLRPNPGPSYQVALRAMAEAERQKLLRNLALEMAQQLGGDIAKEGRSQSVIDVAIQELEGWAKTLTRVRELAAQETGSHQKRRKEKYAIGARSYITDPSRYAKAAEVEQGLYQRHKPIVWRTLLGPDPNGASGAGFYWEPRKDGSAYFDYQITTKEKLFRLNPRRPDRMTQHAMLGEGSGAEQIAEVWQAGALRMLAERIRSDNQARVAAYLPQLYNGQQVNFVNTTLNPNSRALVQLWDVQPEERREEHYLAIDATSDDTQVNTFYGWFAQEWAHMNKVFLQSESDVACTFLSLYHGLELDHFRGFVEHDPIYRSMESSQGCLHLFPEERLAADYEARIPALRRPEWREMKRLHPEIVVCLSSAQRVRSFALALVSGLLDDEATDYSREHYLKLPDHSPVKLTETKQIDNYSIMQDNDRVAARLLQAFQTYMLLGHEIGNTYNEIDYEAVLPAFNDWFGQHHRETSLDTLLKDWETNRSVRGLYPLFNAESKDPRFRDLGVMLLLELLDWRRLRK